MEDGTDVVMIEREPIGIDTYRVRWWGTPTSKMSQPEYRIAQMDNGRIRIRYCMIQGRQLGDFIIPYYPITSFVSILFPPAEVAHTGSATWDGGKIQFIRDRKYRPRSGFHEDPTWAFFEIAERGDKRVIRITNEGSNQWVFSRRQKESTPPPLLLEYYLTMQAYERAIPVQVRAKNISDRMIRGLGLRTSYRQEHIWGVFGEADAGSYQYPEESEGKSAAFYAFSEGMQRGYEFIAGKGCELHYRLFPDVNGWEVDLSHACSKLRPGDRVGFDYLVNCTDFSPQAPSSIRGGDSPDRLCFGRLAPMRYESAETKPEHRLGIDRMFEELERPKPRGLNPMAGYPVSLEELDRLRSWGCNLLITDPTDPAQTRIVTRNAHSFGMEVFVSGTGRDECGAPSFEGLSLDDLDSVERPDSFGRDEDHYYWSYDKPLLDFESEFAKPLENATQGEFVSFRSRCFAEKYRRLLGKLRLSGEGSGVWFYTPSPGIAHVDPYDYYDEFIEEVGSVGRSLTVLPFYYGVEYSQAEYMVRRWKESSPCRVVFLVMRDFMSKPSQFFRAITAARRGGADGACGFSFSLAESDPDVAWQWRSVMLASLANFPTPELGAYCHMEDPAELLESFAAMEVMVCSQDSEGTTDWISILNDLLPMGAKEVKRVPPRPKPDRLYLRVEHQPGGPQLAPSLPAITPGKGVIHKKGNIVYLLGGKGKGMERASELLLRFAQLSKVESSADD